MFSTLKRTLSIFSLIAALAVGATADTLNLSGQNTAFSVNRRSSVSFRWSTPPGRVIISRYNGGWNSKPSWQVVHDGSAPSILSLAGGGTRGGGRYKITSPSGNPIRVQVSGPQVKSW